MQLTQDQWIELFKALIPLAVFVLGFLLKLGQREREQVSHALDYALKLFLAGKMSSQEAKSHILATGAVSESAVDRIMFEINARRSPNVTADYKNHVIPGVAVHVAGDGSIQVNPTGLINKAGDRVEKWFKKKFGKKLF